ncbi:glutamate racemase [Paucibacter sp. APW11]|uniref:Glutamate racemase n=1 Tax=Roseateles aquae TaxID=3077235 RepID=A0ABU3P8C6_9BURK|nr:glutamate racemase [Paucibacter sp. APW11]MDT8998542.1 glutamate racemase [Paucibacter sp. APW11]
MPFIGVFDSGVGGLTVLRALRARLPDVALRYVADSAHAPYGPRSSEFIAQRSLAIAEFLIDEGAALLVVACNTATAHAVNALRERWPLLPVVGIEPGIKPAVAASRNGKVGVMATTATLASARYQELLRAHAQGCQIISQACPGLVDLIETGQLDQPAIREKIQQCCAPLREAGVDTVLLGCTHYPFVQQQIQAELGAAVSLLNIEDAVARQAQKRWQEAGLASTPIAPSTAMTQPLIYSTGKTDAVSRMASLALGANLRAAPIEV